MSVPDACQLCRKPVLIRQTRIGTTALFDPDPVIGGPWRDEDGTMTRRGSGPRPGYHLHERTCTEVVLAIPTDDTWKVSEQGAWNTRSKDDDDSEDDGEAEARTEAVPRVLP